MKHANPPTPARPDADVTAPVVSSRSSRWLTAAVVLVLSLLASLVVATPDANAAGTWHDTTRDHRIEFSVDPDGTDRNDTDVTFDVDLDQAFDQAGSDGTALNTSSLRVIEVSGADAVIDANVPFQFDPVSNFNATTRAHGELTVLLDGSTTSTRTFQLYFTGTGSGGFTPVDHSGLGRVSLSGVMTDAGRDVRRVTTDTAVWFYDLDGAGFTSIVADGADWINWNSTAGSSGTFRGIPNLVHPEGFFHPGNDVASTGVIATGPLRVVLESTTNDGEWTTRWAVHRDRAVMELTDLPNGADYWFLYEGTPGGTLDSNDVIIRNSGATVDAIDGAFAADLPGIEWIAAADTNRDSALWMAQITSDSAVDSYKGLDDVMTVMAFGRQATGVAQGLGGTATFAVGLVDADTKNAITPLVAAATDPFDVVVANGERLDGAGSTTTAPTTTSAPAGGGYWILTSQGRMLPFGLSTLGDAPTAASPAVAAAATGSGNGYWIVRADGTVDVFGDAVHHGDASALSLAAPIVGMAVAPSGDGYWLLGRDGGIFSYNVPFFGSTGDLSLKAPVTDMAATPTGLGYHLVAEDGGIFAFGDALFRGSTGALTLDQPVTSMTSSASGYWMVALDGGIFAFNATFHGSLPQVIAKAELPEGRRIRAVDGGSGYLILSADGGLFAFGSADDDFLGSASGLMAPGEIAVDLILVD